MSKRFVGAHAGLVVGLVCLAVPVAAQQAPEASAAAAAAQVKFSASLKVVKHLEKALKDAQDALRARDEVTAEASDPAMLAKSVSALAQVAQDEAELQTALGNARRELDEVRAHLLAAVTVRTVGTLAARDVPDAAQSIKQAKEAQATVAALKVNAEQGFKRSDTAIVNALDYVQSIDMKTANSADMRAKVNAALQHASEAHGNALKVNRKAAGAQVLANHIVEGAMAVAGCDLGGDCSKLPADQRERLAADLKQLSDRKDVSDQVLEKVKLASLRVDPEVLQLDGRKKEWALQALAFVDRNPDARALFGAEAARLSASGTGAKAAIRLDLDRRSSGWLSDTSLVLSTPIAGEGRTALASSPDGFPSDTWLTLSRAIMLPASSLSEGPEGELPKIGRWLQLGLSLGVGHKSFAVAAEDLASTQATTYRRTPWTVGGHALLVRDSQASHQMSLNIGRDYTAGGQQQRCPTQPVSEQSYLLCKSAIFTAPSDELVKRLSYNYRREWPLVGVSPTLAYDFGNRQKTFELPVYLIRDTSADGSPLTAGISFAFQSKTKDPDSKATRQWSLFVTAPLSLLGE